ncbi:MAG TPA: DUF6438 domain-containing protein [Saprospiraceae bacterium]|nr:DUF6438 domain-containing protein [Saprospiraceae bacterium]HMO40262.1 DUF6438 domain-containing protein [Saprospiraceae bacterium]HMP23289.1 DUF6438 domain-containing protein [Saprospiraceae bacterium]
MQQPRINKYYRLCVWLGLLLTLTACDTNRALLRTDFNRETRVIEMAKSPCYGRCPVFRLTVYASGLVSFDGERYTERTGFWVKKMDKNEYQNLLRAFRNANLWQFDNVYRGEYYDAPTVTISYYEEGDLKTIIGKDGRPNKVLELEALLDDLARTDGWVQIGATNYGLPENVIADELIVQLHDGRDGPMWTRKYRRYEMEVVRQVAPQGNYWLCRYNPAAAPPEEMLSMVRADREVIGAEFNKKISARGR